MKTERYSQIIVVELFIIAVALVALVVMLYLAGDALLETVQTYEEIARGMERNLGELSNRQ